MDKNLQKQDIKEGFIGEDPAFSVGEPETASAVEATPPVEQLLQYAGMDNIAEELDDNLLMDIGRRAIKEYEDDNASRSEWLKRNKQAIELASQVLTSKSYPWDGAANTSYPLIADAAIQFNSRAYPSIIKGNDVVKGIVVGEDPSGAKTARADRISKHMSYQYLFEMDEWEEDTDKLLIILPIVGNVFRKSYYSPGLQRVVTKLVRAENLIYHYDSNFCTTPRITEEIKLYQQEITERVRMGVFRDIDLNIRDEEDEPEEEQEFIEQHRREDLDGDGYKEPYIVTVHQDTKKVVRIVSNYRGEEVVIRFRGRIDTIKNHTAAVREMEAATGGGQSDVMLVQMQEAEIVKIDPVKYYTKYTFIPSLEGKGYDLGLGQLIGPLNETINTNLNQMLDAGSLSNLQGGFVSSDISSNGRQGDFNVGPNEWIPLDSAFGSIRDKVLPFNFQGPNQVVFSLLQFLIATGKELAAINTDTEAVGANESPNTYMARLAEGLRVFNGVYKRVYRALSAEFKILFRLNGDYLNEEEYFRVMDTEEAVKRIDYRMEDVDIMPVSEPGVSTTEQRMAKAQVVYQVGKNNPRYNQYLVEKEYLDAMGIPGIDRILLKDEDMPEPPPDPDMIQMQAKVEKMGAETERVRAETAQTYNDIQAKVIELQQQFEKLDIERLSQTIEYLSKVVTQQENYEIHKDMVGSSDGNTDKGRIPGVERQPGNSEGTGNPPGENQPPTEVTS